MRDRSALCGRRRGSGSDHGGGGRDRGRDGSQGRPPVVELNVPTFLSAVVVIKIVSPGVGVGIVVRGLLRACGLAPFCLCGTRHPGTWGSRRIRVRAGRAGRPRLACLSLRWGLVRLCVRALGRTLLGGWCVGRGVGSWSWLRLRLVGRGGLGPRPSLTLIKFLHLSSHFGHDRRKRLLPSYVGTTKTMTHPTT